MDSYWALFCVVGVVYTLILTLLFYGKGLLQIIWTIILAVCAIYLFEINPTTEMFVINEELVPMWIFHPLCLVGSPILAVIFVISIRMQEYQNRK